MKKIVERLKETNPDRIPAFKAAAASQVREILDKIDKFQCFVGENSDGEKDMVALMDYREDGMTTYMLFWIDGLVEEKVVCTPFMFSCTGNKKKKWDWWRWCSSESQDDALPALSPVFIHVSRLLPETSL